MPRLFRCASSSPVSAAVRAVASRRKPKLSAGNRRGRTKEPVVSERPPRHNYEWCEGSYCYPHIPDLLAGSSVVRAAASRRKPKLSAGSWRDRTKEPMVSERSLRKNEEGCEGSHCYPPILNMPIAARAVASRRKPKLSAGNWRDRAKEPVVSERSPRFNGKQCEGSSFCCPPVF